MPITAEKFYDINYYDVDWGKKALISSIVNFLQDLAVKQSDDLGMSVEFLIQKNIAWVLYKWEIHIDEYPALFDKIRIKTWPCDTRKLYAFRKFEMYNGDKLIGYADSSWLLIDYVRRRPIRIPDYILSGFDVNENPEITMVSWDIAPVESLENSKEFRVRYGDIDTNKHVNNVKYIEWALETLPVEILDNKTMTVLKGIYEREAHYGRMIKSVTEPSVSGTGAVFRHSIFGENGDRLAIFETEWR